MNSRITGYIVGGIKKLVEQICQIFGHKKIKESYPVSARDCLLYGNDYLRKDETKKEESAPEEAIGNNVKIRKKTAKKKAGSKKKFKKDHREKENHKGENY